MGSAQEYLAPSEWQSKKTTQKWERGGMGDRKAAEPCKKEKGKFCQASGGGGGGPGESKEANKYSRDQTEPRRDMPDRSQQISTETERRRLASCPESGVAGTGNAIHTQHAPQN